ncbi:MAG: MerR family transcriptional regulator [Actinomycetota bacterium]|nr:MerR family transcriptional regulator [Actinomycetota bacterium]
MLTIGQLANYVGVTVRAVRHYHKVGLLPEPARDSSGYRRYDADAVVDLIRIKTLSDAAVPLARIEEVLKAEPTQFSDAIAEIDEALAKRIRDLKRQRHRITQLDRGDSLFLPAEAVDLLDELRSIGVSPQTVAMERDGWILLMAGSPHRALEWVTQKRSALDDPQFRELYLACDRALDWDPADPRLEELADTMVALAEHRPVEPDRPEQLSEDDAPVAALMSSYFDTRSPSWKRLNQLCVVKMQATRPAPREGSLSRRTARRSPS